MKIATDKENVELSGVEEQGEFKIKNSAKAFSILSSGLYSNKILAVVRELSCNAWDSHKEAGKVDVPFECHLPTSIEPYFSVRDFGLGLDHEGVTKLYTTYFESTKSDSNDYIGALGLGSKSPFSYTDNFTVSAIFAGKKRIYTAYINEHGVPSIALMDESETEEVNGVEVSFGIKSDTDYYRFADEATDVYRWFPLKPIMTGKKISMNPPEYDRENFVSGIHLMKHGYPMAIQGNIAYPIRVPDTSVFGNLKTYLQCPLVIEFEIGELDIAASREELSYIDLTINSIRKKLEFCAQQASVYVRDEIVSKPTKWEKLIAIHSLSYTSIFAPSCEIVAKELKLNFNFGNTVRNQPVIKVLASDVEARGIIFQPFTASQYKEVLTTYKLDTYYNYDNGGRELDRAEWKIVVNPRTLFVVNDTVRRASVRLKSHFKTNRLYTTWDRVVLLDANDRATRAETIKYFLKDLGEPTNVIYVSDLSEHITAAAAIAKTDVITLGENPRHQWGSSDSTPKYTFRSATDEVTDDTKTYLYVPVKGHTPTDKRITGAYDRLSDFYTAVKDAAFDIQIYGLRKAAWATAEKKANWVNVLDYLEKELNTVDHVNYYNAQIRAAMDDDIFTDEFNRIAKKRLPAKHKLVQLVNISDAAVASKIDLLLVKKRCKLARSLFGTAITLDKTQEGAYNTYNAAISNYTLFEYINAPWAGDKRTILANEMIDYICAIDTTKEKE